MARRPRRRRDRVRCAHRRSGSAPCALTDELAPAELLAAYRAGFFPMPLDDGIGWFSPDPRGVIPLDGLRVSRSLRRSMRRYVVTFNTDFAGVMRACGDPARPHGWINEEFVHAYTRLHALGHAHSVETRLPDGALVGGLYGVAVGGFFAGESMFSAARDTSKVALVALVDALRDAGATLLDVQWVTPHLASLGAVEVPRPEYLRLLTAAVARPELGRPFRD